MDNNKTSEKLSCMSFNLWGGKDWKIRKDAVLWIINRDLPDTFGIQEGKIQWLKVFESELSDVYGCTGEGNSEAGYTETFNNIYYKKERFQLKSSQTIWLSDDIHIPGTKFAESKRVRIAVMAVLNDRKTSQDILFVNTHLDNLGDTPRKMQIRVLLKEIEKYNLPCVLTGDFNSGMETEVYHLISENMNDSRVDATKIEASEQSYNGAGENNICMLDYCFFTKDKFILDSYRCKTELYENKIYPSDHNPVLTQYHLIIR